MREIKFRGYLPETKEMVYFPEFYTCHEYGSLSWRSDHEEYSGIANFPDDLDQIKVMQYTGLKDKNGKEIYEGDIIQCSMAKMVSYWEVIWGENTERGGSMWGWMTKTDTGVYTLDQSIRQQGKIIGNIYEHSELLNPSQSE